MKIRKRCEARSVSGTEDRREHPIGSRDGIEAQVDRIMEKLGRLRRMDSGCKVFGAKAHRYRLGAPLSKSEISKIERRLGVPLPDEYRLFLMRAGHGGAGPYYGLFRLDGDDPEDITDRNQIRKPFRWDDSFNPYALEDPASEEDVWFEELDEEDFDEEDSDEGLGEDAAPVVELNVPGALYLCHYGCGIRYFLIVKGKCTGEIWLDSQADDQGIIPECGARGERLGFLDWYEKWLDDGIATVSREQ